MTREDLIHGGLISSTYISTSISEKDDGGSEAEAPKIAVRRQKSNLRPRQTRDEVDDVCCTKHIHKYTPPSILSIVYNIDTCVRNRIERQRKVPKVASLMNKIMIEGFSMTCIWMDDGKQGYLSTRSLNISHDRVYPLITCTFSPSFNNSLVHNGSLFMRNKICFERRSVHLHHMFNDEDDDDERKDDVTHSLLKCFMDG